MKFKVVPLMYTLDRNTYTITLNNAESLGGLLSGGWRVVRTDVLPGINGKEYKATPDACFEPPLPPTLVYILAGDGATEDAPSDEDFIEKLERLKSRLEEDHGMLRPLRELHGDNGYIRAAGRSLESAIWNIETLLTDGD